MIRVGGLDVREERFIERLRSTELHATRRLISQLKDDRSSGGSLGLQLVSRAFGRELATYIARIFPEGTNDVESLLNETLQRVLTRIDSFDSSRSAFRTWLYEQAKYAVLDAKRKDRRQLDTPPEHESDLEDGLEAAVADDAGPLTSREKTALRSAMRKLNPLQRQLLWWRYVMGYTPTEIARQKLAEGVREEHVKVYVSRAVQKLRDLYLLEVRR
jgi:RNA polymerase sigma factor (sigma-70 family)